MGLPPINSELVWEEVLDTCWRDGLPYPLGLIFDFTLVGVIFSAELLSIDIKRTTNLPSKHKCYTESPTERPYSFE
ncbi:hypothetical protein BDW42DRAFT_33766 [Aspergillus taichungensis]|uniref:Uncharacterized protein n=1 Tax=Aspergillus taichungensis TaxID=482145 RepID=A0A2J5HFS4_9EURO|nr:hypothetical protein BDW42DRAFT_33766 [Aspergillus taichungensis]